jgi:hypothetical protein
MYYTIYKTTNTINGKFYIGKHQTTDANDNYYGSGKKLELAIKKYGKENFTKEVLFIFDNEYEMNSKEKELITEEFVNRKDTYNVGIGGEGGPHFKGKKHTDEAKAKIKLRRRNFTPLDIEARKKISEANKKRTITDETRNKLSVKAYLRNGRSVEEIKNLLSKPKQEKIKRSKSDALKNYFANKENRKKLSEKMKILDTKYNFLLIKLDIENGLKPKQIREKYNMSKNTYDYLIPKYIKNFT